MIIQMYDLIELRFAYKILNSLNHTVGLTGYIDAGDGW